MDGDLVHSFRSPITLLIETKPNQKKKKKGGAHGRTMEKVRPGA